MNIVVCVKQVPDPETPPAGFKVDPVEKRVIPPLGAAPVISPFDENAVEAALRVKDKYGGNVTALTMGPPWAEDVLRQAIAMGADAGVLLENSNAEDFDSYSTAYCLAMAIKKIGIFDLVLCGREAADWNAGQVGSGIAEFLEMPSVTLVKDIELINGKLRLERVIPDGFELIEVTLPVLVTVTNELGQPRYATAKGIMTAKKRQIKVLATQDIGVDASKLCSTDDRLKLVDIFIPAHEIKCHIFEADSVEEAAVALANKIIELNPR